MRHVPKRHTADATASRAAAALLHAVDRRARDPHAWPSLQREEREEDLVALAERLLCGADFGASLMAATALSRIALTTPRERERAVVALVDTIFFSDPDAPDLASLLRRAAIDALARLDPDDELAIGAFIAASRDPDRAVAERAIAALARCRSHRGRALRALGPFLHDPDPGRRGAAGRALLALGAAA